MGIFRVLHRTNYNPILALLAIARLAEVDWDATAVEWFPFIYDQSKFIFMPPVPEMTRKCANGREVTKGGHDEVRPIYRDKFTDRCMYRFFSERDWLFCTEKGDGYTKYPILEE